MTLTKSIGENVIMDSRVIATMGSTRISVTNGFEDNAKENYILIRALANHVAKKYKITMDRVVSFMTGAFDPRRGGSMIGLRAGSFNNYCRTGVVSEFTVNKLYSFFDKEVPLEIINGRNLLSKDPKSIVIIFSKMMDKLYQSSIVTIDLYGREKPQGVLPKYSLNDYVKVLISDVKSGIFLFPDERIIELHEIEESDLPNVSQVTEITTAEAFNDYIRNTGLESYMVKNEQFISLINHDTLNSFELSLLVQCREEFKRILDIFDSVIKFKEAKTRQSN